MKIFKITDKIEVVCTSESTRYGFRHLATLFINGDEVGNGKCTYQNRTWESYEFQSVLFNVINKSNLSESDNKICHDYIQNYKESNTMMKTTMMVASLGNVFGNTKKEKNDWKLRMIKAGLQHQGLSIPDDWETLAEQEKETRLNKVIEVAKKNE